MTLRTLSELTTDLIRELAIAERVCVRPVIRRVLDRETGADEVIPLPCGSTLESVCPSCAHKARILRMRQCEEGWHLGTDPYQPPEDQDDGYAEDEDHDDDPEDSDRVVRSTRRRRD